jgi:hypothetical protein
LDEIGEILLRLGFKGRRTSESGDFPNQYKIKSLNGDNVVLIMRQG